jgi:CheY-like chemotaxis protein
MKPAKIRRALEDSGGVIKQAARLLELTHQGLQRILNTRHIELRKTVFAMKERKGIASVVENSDDTTKEASIQARTLRILHVEDNDIVAGMAKEMLETQGWYVDSCTHGNEGLERINGTVPYDLLLLDYDLPGVNGLDLVRRARKLNHRARIPIVVLSATPMAAAAREAGADVFLQKPQDIGSLVDTIGRLLHEREHED